VAATGNLIPKRQRVYSLAAGCITRIYEAAVMRPDLAQCRKAMAQHCWQFADFIRSMVKTKSCAACDWWQLMQRKPSSDAFGVPSPAN
jgi:hypothetical protein